MDIKTVCIFVFLLACPGSSCTPDDAPRPPQEPLPDPVADAYFPPLASEEWETVPPESLQWNVAAEQPLYEFLEARKTRAFIILKDGKIAEEFYFGTFTKDSLWYWASAGKTLTAVTVGIAQQQGLLELTDKTSDYLGIGWTGAPAEKESLITIWHQLTMTSGLDDSAFDCTSPDCLEYSADAGTRWAYHNGPYTLLQEVVAAAASSSYSAFFNTHLRNKIGMNGFWASTNGQNSVYFSNARSMARFGLLNLRQGIWHNENIITDAVYRSGMISSSQELNASYGYLWWLNGKSEFMVPGLQFVFNGPLIPEAPSDTYAGLGKNDQKLYIVPSKKLVVLRMGEDTGDGAAGPSSFDNLLWEKINALIP